MTTPAPFSKTKRWFQSKGVNAGGVVVAIGLVLSMGLVPEFVSDAALAGKIEKILNFLVVLAGGGAIHGRVTASSTITG